MHNVTLIPGDGVGPEIADATRKCVEATGVKINWDVQECGIEVIEKVGKVPDSVLASIRKRQLLMTPLVGQEQWYIYHPLLAEFLRAQLQSRYPDEVPEPSDVSSAIAIRPPGSRSIAASALERTGTPAM